MKEDFKHQLRKLYFIIVFCIVWLGIPYYFVNTFNEPNFYVLAILTWVPAMFVTMYLNEK